MGKRKIFHYNLQLLGSLSFGRVFNLLLVEASFLLSRIFRKVILFGKPWAASIEPTTFCNLRCPECPTGMQSILRAKGNLDLINFNCIIEKLSPNLIYLTLYFQGEPMLNPHFADMVKSARNRRIFVATSTNGHYLNDENISRILDSGLNHLIISMDGLDQETYGKYRVKGNLNTVVEGIQRLVAARKAAKTTLPFIELQFIVMRHNQHQMEGMREFALKSGVDKMVFKTAQAYNFDPASSIIPTLAEKSRYHQLPDGSYIVAKKIKNRCHRIWSSLVVTWDGKVVPCCYDKDAEHQNGNLFEHSLDNLWKNQVSTSFRQKVLNKRSEIGICRNCGE